MEDDLNMVECFCEGGSCIINPVCELKSVLTQALTAYLDTLERYTLKDLLEPRRELARVLGMRATA
jgi:Rrf2 family nitric oxide-sensitive transcriptional repressor